MAVLLLSMCSWAQFRASIQGTIQDSTGAVVAGAKITVVNQDTGVVSSAVSTSEGFYRVGALPPGRYTITVEAASFERNVAKDVAVAAEIASGHNVTLKVGSATETVTVTATPSGVQTENANVSTAITSQQISRLPQNGRDPYQLARLAPGVFGDAGRSGNGNAVGLPNGTGPGGSNSAIFQTENQVQISANGQRVSANNYQIDGVSVNSLTWGGAAVVTPNQESVKELSVTSGTYSAEDGRNSGVQMKVVSNTGTNRMHGSGFFKYDEPGLNAYNKYGGFGNAKPIRVNDKYRQFGGSIGGPIVKDKLFYFFSYEGLRSNRTDYGTGYVETQQYRDAVASLRTGSPLATIMKADGIQPRILKVLTPNCGNFVGSDPANPAWPCQVVGGGMDIGSLSGAYGQYVPMFSGSKIGGGLDGAPDLEFVQYYLPNSTTGNQFNGRLDYARGNNQFAFSTFITLFRSTGADSGSAGRPMADVNRKPVNSAYTALWNRTFTPTLLNEARVNVTRWTFNQVDSNSSVNWAIPRIEIEGMPIDRVRFGAPRDESLPGIFAENQYEFRDTLTNVRGKHALKVGFETRREQDNNNLLGGSRPIFTFVGPWNLANGAPVYEAINADPRTGKAATGQRYFRSNDYAWFVQDDWKIRRNLTLNIGLRWEYFTSLHDKAGQISNLELGTGASALMNAKMVTGKSLFPSDHNNFAPRFGFAYSPLSDDKVVVRGGFGVSYNRLPDVLYANTRGNPPYMSRFNICCGTAATEWGSPFVNGQILFGLGSSNDPASFATSPTLAQGFDPATGLPINGSVELWGAPQNTRTPYVYTYSLETEVQMPAKMTATLGYQGSTSHKLIRIVNEQFMYDQLNPKFYAVYFPTPDINANFNALNARLHRAFSGGLQFDTKYRWSKSIDQLSNEGPGAETNQTYPRDLRYERGPSDYDATHFVTIAAMWDIPVFRGRNDFVGKVLGGWSIDGVFTFHSGFPWTPKTNRQALQFPSGTRLSPIRPIAYHGGAGTDASTDTFIRQNGNFPGGGEKYFDISGPGVPGIGRNSFRGPRYQAVDLSINKSLGMGFTGLGEQAKLDLRMNLFNAFNKLNLSPLRFYGAGTIVEDSHFGMADSALAGRTVELQARFSF